MPLDKFHFFWKSMFYLIICYSFVFGILILFPPDFQKNGLLKASLDFSYLIRPIANHAAKHMSQSHLAADFIGNMHKLSTDQSNAIQSSGLVHLLAISGAQLIPVAAVFSRCFALPMYRGLRSSYSSIQLMLLLHVVKSVVEVTVAFALSFLFGCTGALLRVAVLRFLPDLRIFTPLKHFFHHCMPHLPSHTALRVCLLIAFSIFFGNIFLNYSFILSAIGASCAELCSRFLYSGFFKARGSGISQRMAKKLLKQTLVLHLISTVLTSALVGIFLSPLTPNPILNSCFANICAIALITYWVTPLALFVLVVPQDGFIYRYILKSLDLGLGLFDEIAHAFSSTQTSVPLSYKDNPLFTQEGLAYLNALVVFLWITLDLIKHRHLIQLRARMFTVFP